MHLSTYTSGQIEAAMYLFTFLCEMEGTIRYLEKTHMQKDSDRELASNPDPQNNHFAVRETGTCCLLIWLFYLICHRIEFLSLVNNVTMFIVLGLHARWLVYFQVT